MTSPDSIINQGSIRSFKNKKNEAIGVGDKSPMARSSKRSGGDLSRSRAEILERNAEENR